MWHKITRKALSSLLYVNKLVFRPNNQGIVALNYHRINDRLKPDELVTPIDTFRKQMEYLSKHCQVVGIEEILRNKTARGRKQEGKPKVVITFDDGYLDNYQNTFPILKEFGFTATVFLATGYIDTNKKSGRYKDVPWQRDFLNRNEIKEMVDYGISFGAHTVNHPQLTQISLKQAKAEIEASKQVVNKLVGKEVRAFCYPSGEYNEDIKRIVKEAGYEMAFSVRPGANTPKTDLFELRRTGMNGIDTLFDLKKKLSGAYDLLHKAVQNRNKNRARSNPKVKTNRRINVLYIIWSLGLGGAERVVINLAKDLNKRRFNVLVLCLNEKGMFANELERDGIKVIALNKKGKFDISVITKLSKIIKQNDIKIVHTHLWGANFWGRIAAKLANVPVIIATEHNADTWKNKLYFTLDRWLSRWTDKITVVSDSVKEFYIKEVRLSSEKICIIHNGIDIRKYAIALPKKGGFNIEDGQVTLGVIGRLVPQKGHRYFLLALKELLNSYQIKGLIIGSGPLEGELKQFSQNLGLNGKVIFTGLREDIPDLLKTIDILVMPSLREGLPITALEAMACGIPVVATNVGGNPEAVIDGHTGFLVAPENPELLVKAITKLIESKDAVKRFGENGCIRVKEYFSVEKMVKEIEELYEEQLIKKGKR